MISFKKLGSMGRLGNQLFQYAFLRTQAKRMGVKFYCPDWIGEEIFDLKDDGLVVKELSGIANYYKFSFNLDWNSPHSSMSDNTDIEGFFESEKFFDNVEARDWFSFKKNKIFNIKEKYKHLDFSKCVGVHMRFGDKISNTNFCKKYFLPKYKYYLNAFKRIGRGDNFLVFSDDIEMAKTYLSNIDLNFTFIEDNKDWEDLFLMSQCRDFVCAPSTFSWWGAWLNNNLDKKIVFPLEGTIRPPLFRIHRKNLIPKNWIKIRALRLVIDSYLIVAFPKYEFVVELIFGKIGPMIKKLSPRLYIILKPYFPDINVKENV